MNIRKATNRDIEGIVLVGRKSFTRAFAHLFPSDVLERYLDQTYSPEKITASLSKSDNIYAVAETQDGIVGFLKLKLNCPQDLIQDAHQIQLQKIYVLPQSADAGVGSKLMQTAEQKIFSEAPDCAWLMVYENNCRAISFYERFGYVIIGKAHHDFEQIRVNFAVMKKNYRTKQGYAGDRGVKDGSTTD
jgi:ribosomal protein S18 acetylase RimI-like enzyme